MTCLEVPIHVFGTYCILFRTPGSMKSVKWSLFNLHFWSASLDLTLSLLVVPFLFLPTQAGFTLGLFHDFGLPSEFELFFTLAVFSMVGVAIMMIFENRFFVLFAQDHWWRHARRPYLTLNFLLALAYYLPTYLMTPEQTSARKAVIEKLWDLPDEIQTIPFFVSGFGFKHFYSIAATELLNITQPFVFCALLVWNMKRTMKRRTLSNYTLNLQKAFLRAVLIQISTPLLILWPPLSYIAVSLMFRIYNQAANNMCFLLLATHGLSSTVIMLLIHKPYREVCTRILCRKSHSWKSSVSDIVLVHSGKVTI